MAVDWEQLLGPDPFGLGEDEEDTPPAPPPPRELDRAGEADLALVRLAADEAALQVRTSKAEESRSRTEKAISRLQAEREQLVASLDAPELAENPDAQHPVAERTQQLLLEVDHRIQQWEIAGPHAHLADNDLGTFKLNQNVDPASGAKQIGTWYSDASGEIGEALRQFEDAELAYKRTLEERGGDQHSLRVQDAVAERLTAVERMNSLRAEVERRTLDQQREVRHAEEAQEVALARAAALDEQARKAANEDRSLSAEDKAIKLASLAVPMSERRGAKEKWNGLVAEAAAKVKTEAYERRIRNGNHGTVFLDNDPLMRYLRTGDRMELGEYSESYRKRSPAEAEALRLLGGVDGWAEHVRTLPTSKTSTEQLEEKYAEGIAL